MAPTNAIDAMQGVGSLQGRMAVASVQVSGLAADGRSFGLHVRVTVRVVSVGASVRLWRIWIPVARLRKQPVGLNRGYPRVWGLYA
jgi:hypothetical protein